MATLGRVLFYDKNLSKDKTISCASCHAQSIAFSDDKAFSDGIENRATDRNSLALGAVFSFSEYYGNASFGRIPFFWDNRASSVQEQSEQTFANPNEMGMEMHQVLERVKEMPYYTPLMKAAFGLGDITEQKILDAINEFVNSLGSFNAPFDKALDNEFRNHNNAISAVQEDFALFNAQENLGKRLYLDNCASCHGPLLGRSNQSSRKQWIGSTICRYWSRRAVFV